MMAERIWFESRSGDVRVFVSRGRRVCSRLRPPGSCRLEATESRPSFRVAIRIRCAQPAQVVIEGCGLAQSCNERRAYMGIKSACRRCQPACHATTSVDVWHGVVERTRPAYLLAFGLACMFESSSIVANIRPPSCLSVVKRPGLR